MSSENWHEERDRLLQLLEGIESGRITHVDQKDLRQLQATSPENIAVLRKRLAQLNTRIGDAAPSERPIVRKHDNANSPDPSTRGH